MSQLTVDLNTLTPARARLIMSFVAAWADPDEPKDIFTGGAAPRHSHTHNNPPVGSKTEKVGDLMLITPGAAAAMDETAGLTPLAPPTPPVPPAPTPAPVPAAASTTASAPAVQQVTSDAPPVPPAPPVGAPVPVPPAPPASGATPGALVIDGEGLTHDLRIHSEKPTITEKGVWRRRRGLNDPNEAAMKRDNAAAVEFARAAGAVITLAEGATPPAPPAPQPPAPPAPVPPTPPAAVDPAVTLIDKISKALDEGMIEQDEIQKACASVGMPDSPNSLMQLFKQPAETVVALDAEIDRILATP